jgi:putative endopeptidase
MKIFRSVVVLLLAATSAFAQQAPLKGVEVGDIDKTANPCDDFFAYANGQWRKDNPIPNSMVRWSRRWQSGETTKDKLHDILEEVAKTPSKKGSVEQLIGDHYASCMNEAQVNAQGAKPIQPLFKQIDAIKDRKGLQSQIVALQNLAVYAPFGGVSGSDNHEPESVILQMFASGLGLPDRDYYFKTEDRFKDAREKYQQHITKMFTLVGMSQTDAAAAAKTVFDMETKFAEQSLDNVALRDPAATDHKMTAAELQKLTPSFDWKSYFDATGISTAKGINVGEPKFMQEVERQLKETPLPAWKTYLKWHLLRAAAPSLSAPIEQEAWAFNQQYLGGAKEMKPRWKRCVESTDQLLGEALGQKYTEKYFPPAAKARAEELVHNLLLAMGDDIKQLEWMSGATKEKALRKLSTFNPKIGYPDKWIDYSSVPVTRASYFDNVAAGLKFNVVDDRKQIGKPVDRGRWGMTPPTSNAYYNPLLNEIVFPAGILQPPGFSMDVVDAVNYGAIGVVIGHEISHGFDDQGAQFDADGKLNNWWTEDDLKKFQARGACVVDQFDNYFIEPGVHHNGKLVLGESIGDLGGAKIAYLAWKKALAQHPMPENLDGFTPDQVFFIAWGQFRGDEIRLETQRTMVQGDPHPIGKYRVNGPLSNLPEFQKAFGCKAGDNMVRPPEKQCEVW